MEREGGEGGKEGGKFEEEVEKTHTVFCRRRLEMWPLPVSRAAFVRAARRSPLPCSDSARERPSSQLVHGIALAALGERSTARPFDSFFGRRPKSSPSKKSDQIKPERCHFFFLPSLSLSSLALCVPSPPARGKRGTPSAWRAACPLRHRPLSPSSRTSSRARSTRSSPPPARRSASDPSSSRAGGATSSWISPRTSSSRLFRSSRRRRGWVSGRGWRTPSEGPCLT